MEAPMLELPTAPGDTHELLAQSAARLRLRARRLRDAHEDITDRIEALRWRGYGASRFRRMVEKELVQLDHCSTRVGRAATILDGLADDAKKAAAALERKEDEVRAAIANWPGGEAGFLADVGRPTLPPEGHPAWANLWQQVYGEGGSDPEHRRSWRFK
jgi:hypothetical protein